MMKKASFILLIGLLYIGVLHGQIITVDNKYPYIGDYTSIHDAYDAATPGDTIYVYPSLEKYSAINVYKKLTFYGVGYDITENFGEPLTHTSSISGLMSFRSGSEGSLLEGFDGQFGVDIFVNDISLKRNDLGRIGLMDGSGSTIIQNKIIVLNGTPISINSPSPNIFVSNNIIYTNSNSIAHANDIVIVNNVIRGDLFNVDNSVIINNIIPGGVFSNSLNNIVRYNLTWGNIIPVSDQGIGNLIESDMSTVFVDSDNYDFHLLPNSPAKGAGENGTDMGIYGGDFPYIDSGFPGLPSIIQLQAPRVGTKQNGLQINFKAKSNKQ